MPNVTGDNLTFNIDGITNNQILVYNASQGIFVAQDSLGSSANAAVVGGSNVGASGVGVFSAKEGTQLKFKKIAGSGATSVTESANVITISSTAYTLPTPLSIHNKNANTNIFSGRNFGDNANIHAYAGVLNNANYPTNSQSAGFDSKTRFVISSNDAADVELSSQHSLLLRTKSSDGHIEVRSANSTVFYTGSASSTTPALKINSNRSLTVANVFTLPTSDGTNGQVLVTNGTGAVSWTTINTGGISASQLTANLANYIPKSATSMPDTTMSYDIGNSNFKYLNIYANRFRGTADSAIQITDGSDTVSAATLVNALIKTNNLSDLSSAATSRTNLGVYSKAEVDARTDSAQLQNAISTVNVVGSANSIVATGATHAIRFEGGTGIDVNNYTANNTIQISKTDAVTGVFKTFNVEGTNIIADNNNDTLNILSGSNVTLTSNPGTDTLTIDATLNDASIDKYTKTQVNTFISANIDAQRFYKTFVGDSGSTAASAKDDTFNIVGGSGITTVVTGDTVTINQDNINDGIFKNVAIPGQSTIIADNNNDTLNIEAGAGITLTTDANTDKITITNSGSGGGGASETYKTIAVTGSNSIVATSAAETLTFTAGANATITADNSTNTITIDSNGTGSGQKGATGSAGANGNDGDKGQKGEIGAAGSTGATGPQGTVGPAGSSGAAGDKGQKGDQGAQGTQGTTGAAGSTGPQGDAGATGPGGAAGDKGTKGEVGPQGTTGTAGDKGATGSQGPQGTTGSTGPQGNVGPAGSNGNDGDKGQKGDTGADSTVAGPQGNVGPQGSTGPQGDKGATGADSTVAGPQGVAGDKGATGAQGLQGTTGAQGPTGADSTVAGPQGPQGNTGPQGAQGDKGATGAAGSNGSNGSDGNDGAKGQKGELGPQGTTGPQGGQGTKGEVGSQGTVGATGPQGPQGNVGGTGPTGDKGAKGELGGPTGPTGDKGATGAQGPAGSQGGTGSDGAQGPAGDKGSKGEPSTVAGPSGAAGSAGSAGDKGQKGESGGGGSAITVQDEGSSLSTAASTINFVGSGVVASGTGATKTITISGGGGGGATRPGTYERLKLNYSTSGELTSISDATGGINATTITSAAGAEVEIQFTGFNYPPIAIMAHGYDRSNHKYVFNGVSGDWTTRTVDGGGSAGSPTAFGNFSSVANVDLKVTEGITGASRSFGTSTHAWITFVMAE